MDGQRYYLTLAAAFCRGRLDLAREVSDEEALARGEAAGLRLHKFKRNAELPRVHRVLGVLRGLGPSSILDVGSGRGVFLFPLLDESPWLEVTAVDLDRRRAADLGALERGGVRNLGALAMDVTTLGFGSKSFDVVTLLEVLEHLETPALAAAEALRVARRAVIASVPSKPDDNPQHIQLFDARALEALLREAGAARVSIDGVRGHLVALAVAS